MGRGHQKGPAGATLQPRSRRESVFLICTLLIAGFFLWRVCQFKNTQQPQTVWVSTTFPRSHAHNSVADEEDDSTRVVTELVIDNGRDGRGFRQPHGKQLDTPGRKLNDPDRSAATVGEGKGDNLENNPKPLDTSSNSKPADKSLATAGDRAQEAADLDRSSLGIPRGDVSNTSRSDNLAKQKSGDRDPWTLPGLEEELSSGTALGSTTKLGTTQKQDVAKVEKLLNQDKPVSNQLAVTEGSSLGTSQQTALQKTPKIPADFDWQTYLLYHPELKDEGVVSEETARHHYLSRGRAEGYVYRRLRVVLRYTACTGLINQQYSHIAAFALAAVLGAELVLPPAVKRDSFAKYFSMDKTQNEVSWTPDHLDTLLDTEKIIRFWKDRGLTVHRTPELLPFPDLTQPEKAFPLYPQPAIDSTLVTSVSDVYLQNLDMPELIEKARTAVIHHAMAILKADPDREVDYIVLDFPCTFFMLRALSNLRVVTEVAKSLEFSSKIHQLADRVIHGMTNGGMEEYNAVHLRIERDARDWSQIMGGEAVVWHGYVQAMRQAGFTGDLVLYVASGLLTYGANEDMAHIVKTLKEFGLCSAVHYKEMYIPESEISDLNSEQKALLDFLVLSRGRGFVGFGSSTFSFYLREYRVLNGVPRSSSVLVDASVIGTDPLFNSAGTVI
ncbi:hypothetical protein WJX74_002810 [Apatococcus lobatus]|uniref:O-fucosyltransferase family protein n=1 Tax=Apatococcus lobatus TaxID=904363 RepID=A0AAW1SF15_9CHLO